MNELIDNHSGILIQCSSIIKKRNGIDICIISPENIYDSIQKYLTLLDNKKITLGKNARKKYIQDKKFFIEKMKELNNILKEIKNRNIFVNNKI